MQRAPVLFLFLFLFHVTLPLPRYLISRGMIRPGAAVTT